MTEKGVGSLFQPARIAPLLYLGTAHISLALACLLVASQPRAVAGFFYHSWMLAIVHLVTLGWITFSILGSIYVVGPAALCMPLPERRVDWASWALATIGVVGMVAHFWIREFGGMAWSAATVTLAIVYVGGRVLAALRRSAAPPAVRLHIALAFCNIAIAATTGILIAFDKVYHFLPGFVLSNVFAHAHLAALGWGAMMVVGVGYRLLPMTVPSKMSSDRSMFASALLLETGVVGLFVTLLLRSRWSLLFGLLIAAGLGAFVVQVASMWRARIVKPGAARRTDFALLHTAAAVVWLAAATMIGLALLVVPASAGALQAAAGYGALGLVGFLAQMVVAMEARLVPLLAWYWAYARSGYRVAPPAPASMRDPALQTIVFAGWTLGVPALAAGFIAESSALLAIGAWSLFAAVGVGALDNLFVLLHVKRQAPQHRAAPGSLRTDVA